SLLRPRPHAMTSLLAAFVLAFSAALAAQAPVDLLDTSVPAELSLYNPKVTAARVLVLRSDEEARAFAMAAFGEDQKDLHVDFAKEQVVAICWGPRRVRQDFRGGVPELWLDRAVIAEGALQLTLRTQ